MPDCRIVGISNCTCGVTARLANVLAEELDQQLHSRLSLLLSRNMLKHVTPRTNLLGCWLCLSVALVAAVGCHHPGYNGYPPQMPPSPGYQFQPGFQGGFPSAAAPTGQQSVFAGGQSAPQLVELQRRAQELDANNRQLTSQLAQVQQQATAYRERADLLARQIEDVNRQNSQLMATAQQYADQARSLQASMTARGGAKLTANNSVAGTAAGLQIPGTMVVPDGELIRVRIASDQLFALVRFS